MICYYCDDNELSSDIITTSLMETFPSMKVELFDNRHALLSRTSSHLPDLIIATQAVGAITIAKSLSQSKRFPSSQFIILTGTPDLEREQVAHHFLKCTVIEKRNRELIFEQVKRVMNIPNDRMVA